MRERERERDQLSHNIIYIDCTNYAEKVHHAHHKRGGVNNYELLMLCKLKKNCLRLKEETYINTSRKKDKN